MAELEVKRAAMIEAGITLGLTDPETVRLSQEVDRLHNEQMTAERAEKQMRGAHSA